MKDKLKIGTIGLAGTGFALASSREAPHIEALGKEEAGGRYIVVGDDIPLADIHAKLALAHINLADVTVVTIDQAREKGLLKSLPTEMAINEEKPINPPKILGKPPIKLETVKMPFQPPPTRADRRVAERANKKEKDKTMERLLEIGETLYRHARYGYGLTKLSIARVTPTQAVLSDGTKVKRLVNKSVHDSCFNARVISSMYGDYSLSVETPELIEEFKYSEMLKAVESMLYNFKAKELAMPELTKLHDCLLGIIPTTTKRCNFIINKNET